MDKFKASKMAIDRLRKASERLNEEYMKGGVIMPKEEEKEKKVHFNPYTRNEKIWIDGDTVYIVRPEHIVASCPEKQGKKALCRFENHYYMVYLDDGKKQGRSEITKVCAISEANARRFLKRFSPENYINLYQDELEIIWI